MKKYLLFSLLALLLASCFTGCDRKTILVSWDGLSYYVWVNNSDYKVTVSAPDIYTEDGGRGVNVELAPGESRTVIGSAPEAVIPPYQLRGGISVTFDDGTKVYRAEFNKRFAEDSTTYLPEGYDTEYHPYIEDSYDYEEVEASEGCSQCSYGRWIYTFTNADYEAMVEYLEASAEVE